MLSVCVIVWVLDVYQTGVWADLRPGDGGRATTDGLLTAVWHCGA